MNELVCNESNNLHEVRNLTFIDINVENVKPKETAAIRL